MFFQLCASLDIVLLVSTGTACARSYLKRAVCNAPAAVAHHLDLTSLPRSSQCILQRDRRRPRLPSWLLVPAADAMSSTACLSDLCHAAMRSRASTMECFSIFDRPYTVQVQEEPDSLTNRCVLVGVHDQVLSDQALSAVLMHPSPFCHFPLVAPNRRLLHSSILQLKIW